MSSTNNRSGYTDWQHSPEAKQLTEFVKKKQLIHCLISSDDLLARALITDWSKERRLGVSVTCIDASSYLLLKEHRLTPILHENRESLPALVVLFDAHRLSTHHLAEIIHEHTEEHNIKLVLCGNEGLRNAAFELGYSSDNMTLLTRHDVRLTYRVLERLLNEHQAKHPNLPNAPSPTLLADIHEFAEGQVSRIETGFNRWLQAQKKSSSSRSFFKASNEHAFWNTRRFATQGLSLALIAGLSVGGWQQIRHVHALKEPSVHEVVTPGPSKNPYTVTLATSYSKKQLIRYQQQHDLPAKSINIRHVTGKKHRYELDLGNYTTRQAAVRASRVYRRTSPHGHQAL